MDVWSARSSWGLLGFGIACMIYALLSATAHLFHSRSPQAHYTFFQIDYIGIGMYGQGMCLMLYTCAATPRFYDMVYPYFLPLNCVCSITVCMCCSSAKMFFEKPHPYFRKCLQMGACAFHIVFLLVPMYFRLYECASGGEHCRMETFQYHYHYAFWFIISTVLFVSHAPERFFPGKFDIIGHGHQLFHISITYTTVLQFRAGYEDWLAQNDEHRKWVDNHVTLFPVFGLILLTILVDCTFIFLVRSRVQSLCAQNNFHSCKLTNGATQKGATQNGATHNGATQNGAPRNGSLRNGSLRNGTARNGVGCDGGATLSRRRVQ